MHTKLLGKFGVQRRKDFFLSKGTVFKNAGDMFEE
jgi:hypothetical protein